jgi:RHS repeat-associated protein
MINGVAGATTYYVRDAIGNVISLYSKDASINSGDLTQSEVHLYGSGRLGILNLTKDVQNPLQNTTGIYTFERGDKFFELSNHIGNVLTTVSDKKTGVDANSDGQIDYYNADVTTANDYYPGGMMMVGRKFTSESSYRYGFNGKEKDPNIASDDYDFGARIYDGRIDRWLTLDPLAKKYPFSGPYVFVLNTPIQAIDPDGKLTIYASGACHDCDNRGYIKKIVSEAQIQGIINFHEINAHSSSTMNDLNFTVGVNSLIPSDDMYDNIPTKWERDEFGVRTPIEFKRVKQELDFRIVSAVTQIEELYKTKKDNEQFNLVGTSTGSVIQAQAALILAKKGYKIDNLVLDGSAIPKDSKLYQELLNNKNIKHLVRRDLPNDDVSEIGNKSVWTKLNVFRKLLSNSKHPHFEVSRTADGPKKLVKYIKDNGVK